MGSINYLQAIKPDLAYIRKVIANSLLSDWAIRVEYHNGEFEPAGWQLWDKTFFAIRSAEPVLKALIECYTKNPKRAIRLNAEKFHPQSSILYFVYNPQFLPKETEFKPHSSTRQLPREKQDRLTFSPN